MKLTRFQNGKVQVRRITLRARGKPSITLFPMVHVAQPEFFADVTTCANKHDIVLYEGVKASAGRAANAAYRLAASGRSPLMAQNVAMSSQRREAGPQEGAVWINSDVSRETFDAHWAKIPIWQRVLFFLLMPIVGLALRFRRVRDWLAQELDNVADTDHDDDFGPFGAEFKEALMDSRDAHLLSMVEATISEGSAKTIAVVWGAKHMPQLLKALVYQHGFKTSAEEWRTVFVTAGSEAAQSAENSVNA